MEKPPNRDFEIIGEWNYWFPDVRFIILNFIVGISKVGRKKSPNGNLNERL